MSSPRRSLPRRVGQEKKPKPNTPYPSSISRKGNYTFIIYIEKGNLTTERTFFASPESASAQAANHQNLILTRLKKFPLPTFQDNGKIFRNTKNSQKGVNLRDFTILKKKGGCHEKTRKQTFVPLGTAAAATLAIFVLGPTFIFTPGSNSNSAAARFEAPPMLPTAVEPPARMSAS